MNFTDLNLHPDISEGIDAMGFETLTPIQEKAIPEILAQKDIIASAQTGTGKTAAFLLPLIHKIISSNISKKISALIIVPTRELALQIDQQIDGFSYFTSISSVTIFGGRDGISYSTEKQAMQKGVDFVICTPGKMITHLNMGYLDL